MENSGISWTDHTFNPWRGCSKVSPGCSRCYAEKHESRFGSVQWGPNGTRVLTTDAYWRKPIKWNREAQEQGIRLRVFCASLADVFESRDLQEWAAISDGYRINSRGVVESQWRAGGHRGDWVRMKTKLDNGGYEVVQLRKHPSLGSKTLKVHRLMLLAWAGQCPDGMVVRHLDGNRSNNVLWNLVYSSQSDNLSDRARHGTEIVGEKNGRSKLTVGDVEEIRKLLASSEGQSTIKQVAISRIKLGKSWSSKPTTVCEQPTRNVISGQMLDHHNRPLFKCGNKWSFEHDSPSCDWIPVTMDDVRKRLFGLIDATPNLDWLLLTKRPENIREMWRSQYVPHPMPGYRGQNERMEVKERRNVWLGASVDNQEWADKRIPALMKCKDLAANIFLSCEPLLGPIDLSKYLWVGEEGGCEYVGSRRNCIDWVICGGESGPGARGSHPDWFRSLRDQCIEHDVPFHFKQFGEWYPLNGTGNWHNGLETELTPYKWIDHNGNTSSSGSPPDKILIRMGTKKSGRKLDGQEHDGLPREATVATYDA